MVKVTSTSIEGVVILEPEVFSDERGYFSNRSRNGSLKKVCKTQFVQDNESRSVYGVLRGLHFQWPPHAQAKLVRVVKGRVLDIALDIRKGSPTFGRHVATELSDENRRQLFIPRGFAHGFAVLSDEVIFQYKCDNYYVREAEGGILWNDPALGIDWQLPETDVVLSEKDKNNALLNELNLY